MTCSSGVRSDSSALLSHSESLKWLWFSSFISALVSSGSTSGTGAAAGTGAAGAATASGLFVVVCHWNNCIPCVAQEYADSASTVMYTSANHLTNFFAAVVLLGCKLSFWSGKPISGICLLFCLRTFPLLVVHK